LPWDASLANGKVVDGALQVRISEFERNEAFTRIKREEPLS